jgi:hypothetical protein
MYRVDPDHQHVSTPHCSLTARVIFCIAIVFLLAMIGSVSAMTYEVNTAQQIQPDLHKMQDGDILILDPGIYTVNNLHFFSNITIEANTIAGGSPKNTIVDGTGSENGIFRAGGNTVSLTIDNLTLQNGQVKDVKGNGGAIFSTGSVTVTASTISNCAAGFGGAIFSKGPVTVTSSTISNCRVGWNGNGGAIMSDLGPVTVTSSTISNCSAGYGGAIFSNGDTVTITSSAISNCSAGSIGGAIWSMNDVMLTSSTISNCSADTVGGAVFSNHGSVTVISSTISNCSEGKGKDIVASSGTIHYSQITNNTPTPTASVKSNGAPSAAVTMASTTPWSGLDAVPVLGALTLCGMIFLFQKNKK